MRENKPVRLIVVLFREQESEIPLVIALASASAHLDSVAPDSTAPAAKRLEMRKLPVANPVRRLADWQRQLVARDFPNLFR